jgi:hypothetical protein
MPDPPYEPLKKAASIHIEISGGLFSLTSFINCGKREIPVKTLAISYNCKDVQMGSF